MVANLRLNISIKPSPNFKWDISFIANLTQTHVLPFYDLREM